MAATMSAVAKAAGVSIATVSFVVNDTKPVAPQTRARVEQAMKDLGFRRNVVARALASKRTRIVALVYPILEHPMSGNTHEFITGAARAAREADHHLVIWPTSNDADELVELVGQRLVDGVLLMEVQLDDARVEALGALDLPFALIGRPRKVSGLWCVDVDFTASMRIAMNHLTDLGHRNIALVNGSQSQAAYAAYGPFVRSETAYRRLASAQGIKPVVEYSEQSVQAGRKTAAQLLLTAPDTTAVIALYEPAAAGLTAELPRLGRAVPADISVISIFASPEIAAMANPVMTTVTVAATELGRLGAKVLLEQLNGHTRPHRPQLRAGVLVIGDSTAPVRDGRHVQAEAAP